MKYIEIGKTGRMISQLGIGTWKMKGYFNEGVKAIKYALDHGVNFIDTAEMYETEDIVGEAIKAYDRNDIFIATKVWPNHFKYNDLIEACNRSLEKLNTDYIDLYQLHWPNNDVDINETMNAMEKLREENKIMNIGISNFNVDQTLNAQTALKNSRVETNQVQYSLFYRDIETNGIYDYCMKNGISIIAYQPLYKGDISKMNGKELENIAKKYNSSIYQIALAWLVGKNVFPIPKALNINHLKEDIESVNIELEKEDIATLSNIQLR